MLCVLLLNPYPSLPNDDDDDDDKEDNECEE